MDTRPPLLTYGIEIEFLVQCMHEDGHDDRGASMEHRTVMMIPRTVRSASAHVQTEIRKVLMAAVIPVEPDVYLDTPDEKDPTLKGIESIPKRRRLRWRKWVVKSDRTVKQPGHDGYSYEAIEVTTPALDGTTDSFNYVRYVVNLLVSKFRVVVNDTCGLHVHVAPGMRGFDRANLRRIMGFLYAADRLLGALHPPTRRSNHWAMSIRNRSHLSKGEMTVESCAEHFGKHPSRCHEYVGLDVRHGELPMFWRQLNYSKDITEAFKRTRSPGCYEPFQWKGKAVSYIPQMADPGAHDNSVNTTSCHEPKPAPQIHQKQPATTFPQTSNDFYDRGFGDYQPLRPRSLPHIALHELAPNEEKYIHHYLESVYYQPNGMLADRAPEDLGTYHGLAEIFAAPSSCMIDRMLFSGERMNYNMQNYACSMLEFVEDLAPTVEFREAAGSMDARWVATWARICAGLTAWAMNVSADEYLKVVRHCDSGQRGEVKYDVVDLLDELGMYHESEVVENRLRENMTLWRLKPL